jgi:uncharacterized glyoxalase superfamily protein PhnB
MPLDTEIVYAMVRNGDAEIMFQNEATLKQDVPAMAGLEVGASCTFYLETDNLDDYYATVKADVKVLKEPFTTWYGMREFYIQDNNGYVLTIAQAQ